MSLEGHKRKEAVIYARETEHSSVRNFLMPQNDEAEGWRSMTQIYQGIFYFNSTTILYKLSNYTFPFLPFLEHVAKIAEPNWIFMSSFPI